MVQSLEGIRESHISEHAVPYGPAPDRLAAINPHQPSRAPEEANTAEAAELANLRSQVALQRNQIDEMTQKLREKNGSQRVVEILQSEILQLKQQRSADETDFKIREREFEREIDQLKARITKRDIALEALMSTKEAAPEVFRIDNRGSGADHEAQEDQLLHNIKSIISSHFLESSLSDFESSPLDFQGILERALRLAEEEQLEKQRFYEF